MITSVLHHSLMLNPYTTIHVIYNSHNYNMAQSCCSEMNLVEVTPLTVVTLLRSSELMACNLVSPVAITSPIVMQIQV